MLRIIQNNNASGAKSYYSTADYYSEGQELAGQWRGKAAERLGLSGEICSDAWNALCDNRHPETGNILTQRQRLPRRVGYDFNFHVPKSISVLYGLSKDERIIEAFRDSVNATMEDIEAEMQTRVRRDGRNEDRMTGNMVWGEFVHTTARPVDGVPDPHLHAHCFVFNSTYDEKENRWKAGQFAALKRDAPFFEAVFHSRFARRLGDLGLPVERTRKGWELVGIPSTTLEKFSRRTALIEEKAKEKNITNADVKGELGARTRERKQPHLTMGELQAQWESRLTMEELAAVKAVNDRLGGNSISGDDRVASAAIDRAVSHCFERNSVVPERKLLTEAIKQSVGAARPEDVARALDARGLIIAKRDGRRMATTRVVLGEERAMIDFARSGRGTCHHLGNEGHRIERDWLNDGQRRAVLHVLNSPDRVIIVRGGAGTGKTTMMQEAVEGIEQGGKKVFTFAPSADASRGVLRSEGFGNADTVARLLVDKNMQDTVRGNVIWIDEAGLLGARQTAQLFDLADKCNARVILSGDTRQHGSVERGAALRLLEDEAGLIPAEIREIKRQRGAYKQAVHALSEGRTEDGFDQLDGLGWISEVTETNRYKVLADDYVEAIKHGKSALVVSPTHLESEWITDEIRGQLKKMGKLGQSERRIGTLENANLTEAERQDPVNYELGNVLVFHQNAKGFFGKGDRVTVGRDPLPLSQAAKYQVFRPNVLPIAQGDVLRVTRNGKTLDGRHRLNNGAIFTVKGFDSDGNIVLTNDWTISRDYGHLTHGFVVTSHASQGKTVDRVFIGQSSQSFPASSREQFYVSASRGRESVTVYTDDKDALRDAVSRSDDRLSATEFLSGRELRNRSMTVQRMNSFTSVPPMLRQTVDRERAGHER